MNEVAVVHTDLPDSGLAGYALGLQIKEAMLGEPDVVLLFVAPDYNQGLVLQKIQETCHPRFLLGCSSAGEFTSQIQGVGLSCAFALRSDEMKFSLSVGHQLSRNSDDAVDEVLMALPECMPEYPYQIGLVLADALAGELDAFLERLMQKTRHAYQFVGGGAGDNARFHWTPIFCGLQVIADAAVVLAIQSKKPFGIGACHGWKPVTPSFLVTKAQGTHLISLEHLPAVEIFLDYAKKTRSVFDTANPLPFFLHTLIGIETLSGTYILRVPLTVTAQGAIQCAAAIPEGARVSLMSATVHSPIEAAIQATHTACQSLGSLPPAGALFFDCVTTRLSLGLSFPFELQAVQKHFGAIPYAGCNTHGQIIGGLGQMNGFHNCTAVVCLFPA